MSLLKIFILTAFMFAVSYSFANNKNQDSAKKENIQTIVDEDLIKNINQDFLI